MRRRTMTGKTVVREGKAEIDTPSRAVLRDVLWLSAERAASFRDETPLFGALPELDSMAVAGVLTEIEDRLGILIEDDEVDGEMLETRSEEHTSELQSLISHTSAVFCLQQNNTTIHLDDNKA